MMKHLFTPALLAIVLTLTGCAEDGADGAPGMDGTPGADGTDGSDGTNGTNGSDGADGADGTSGADGMDGADGAGSAGVMLEAIGRYSTGVFDEGAAEIVAYDPETERLFVSNADSVTVDVLDISDPTAPTLAGTIDPTVAASGRTLGAANSVAIAGGIAAVAIAADPETDNGVVAFYDTTDLSALGVVEVGALPDMVVFTPDGDTVLVANEGEADGTDPEGSIAIIDATGDLSSATATIAGFGAFESMRADLEAQGLRVIGQGTGSTTLAQDLEPEYITVSEDSATAWVSLQEANAVAVVDIPGEAVIDIIPLGFKDHRIPGNELDASDRDDRINIRSWPVMGMYQPDAIASFMVRDRTYVISANEGDSRGFEEARVKDVTLDPTVFPDAAELQADEMLGRLEITLANGDVDDDGDYDVLYAHGARSFSIWDGVTGRLVYDSGADFEVLTARRFGMDFNNDNDENGGDSRSDAKGPEPEAVTVGQVGQGLFAFIGLERMGGIMVYEITNPESPRFVHYALGRELIDFDGSVASELDAAGDLGPEGLVFIHAAVSPTGEPLLAVANEVSGSTTIYRVAEL